MSKSFVFYTEYKDYISLLSGNETKELLMMVFEYLETGKEPNKPKMSTGLKTTYLVIRNNLVRDKVKYDKRAETSRVNGQKGGRPKTETNDEKEPNSKPNKPNYNLFNPNNLLEPVNVNVNVNVDDIRSIIIDLSARASCGTEWERELVIQLNRLDVEYLSTKFGEMYEDGGGNFNRIICCILNECLNKEFEYKTPEGQIQKYDDLIKATVKAIGYSRYGFFQPIVKAFADNEINDKYSYTMATLFKTAANVKDLYVAEYGGPSESLYTEPSKFSCLGEGK